MSFGVSTACLYPQNTEDALEELGKLGVKTCEIFLNSPSETSPEFARILREIAEKYGMHIVSVHPFSSFSETYMLFGEYKRRYLDALDFYKRCFDFTASLGAGISVIHGSLLPGKITGLEYIERFSELVKAGKEFGVTVCQENVNRHYSENPVFLRMMRKSMGSDFKMVFDVKQAVRAGFSPIEFANEFKDSIIHIHLSDHDRKCDCLPPSKGCFDFKKLIEVMDSADYRGNYIIELYRSNFKEPSELADALNYMQNL